MNVIFAVPSASTFAGQLTTTDSLGWTVTVLAEGSVTVTPSALSVTFTVASVFVALRTSARSSAVSPTRRIRGNAGRSSSGCVERSSLVPSPTIVSPLIARACMRQVVRLSGIFTSTLAVPSSLVVICALQYAVLRKSCRSCCVARPLPPLPCLGSSATTSFHRSTETAIDEPVVTPRPRSNQNARRPSGPRSSCSASTARSTTATESSLRTPLPFRSVTLMS